MKTLLLSVDWSTFVNNQLMPVFIASGSSVLVFLSVLVPLLKIVISGANLFKKTSSQYAEVASKLIKQNAVMEKSIAEINAKTVNSVLAQRQEIAYLRQQLDKTILALRVALGNDTELVKKGYSVEILRILGGESYEENES